MSAVGAAHWRAYVARNRDVFAREFPCAEPTRRRGVCPLHGEPLGSVTRMCVMCHHALFDRLAAAYEPPPVKHKERRWWL